MRFRPHAFALLLLVPSFLPAQESPAAKPEPPAPSPAIITVLKAARLFDGRGDAVMPNGVVVVEGDRIRAAGSGISIPAGARVIDLGDATLLPGLIDAHTHMTGESTDNWLQGTLEGFRRTVADVVAVPGNPLADIKAMEKVSFVMKGGQVFKNES